MRYTKNNCDFIKRDGTICSKPCVDKRCRDHKKCATGFNIPCSQCGTHTHSKHSLCVACEYKLGYHSKLHYLKKKEKKAVQKQIDEKLAEIELLKQKL